MNDKALQMALLRKFHEVTKDGGIYFPKEDDFTPPVPLIRLCSAADKLATRGLIVWKAKRESTGRDTFGVTVYGCGSISPFGARYIESPLAATASQFSRHPLVIGVVVALIGGFFALVSKG